MQKKKYLPVVYSVLIFLAIVCILVDLMGWVSLSIKGLNEIIIFIMSFLSVIFTLWFSYLLVIKQVYTNKYSQEILNKYVRSGTLHLIIYYFVLLIISILLLIINLSFHVFAIYYIINSFSFMVLCGKNISKKIGENEIRKLLENNIENVLCSLKNVYDEETMKSSLNKINAIYDDAYNCLDQSTCKMVIKSYYNFSEEYIKNRNTKIIDNNQDIEKSIDIFISCYMKLLKKDTSDFSIKLNKKILYSLYKLAKIAIDCEIKSLLSKLIDAYKNILTIEKVYFDTLSEDIFAFLCYLEIKSEKEGKSELFNDLLDKSKSLFVVLKFKYNRIDLTGFLRHYVSTLIDCKENKKLDFAKKVLSYIDDIILNEIDIQNCKTIFIILSMIINEEDFAKDDNICNEYVILIKKIINNKSIYCNDLYSFVMYVVDKLNQQKRVDKAKDLQYYLCESALKNTDDVPAYISPDFYDQVKNEIANQEFNKKVFNDINYLIYIVIEKNNIKWLNILLSQIIDILKNIPQHCRDIQLMWLNIYQKSMVSASSADNNNMKDVIFRYYRETLQEMDNRNIISKSLAISVINSLSNLCQLRFRENLDFPCEIVEFLDDLLGNEPTYRFVSSNRDVKYQIYQSLYDIAIDAIERNQELVIQRVSNVIGWKIKYAIENGHGETAEKLINYALSMFELARVNKISHQTIVFVGTLFIIIGAYCQTNTKYFIYKNKIIKGLRKDAVNEQYLVISKQLRCCETGGWKNLLGDNPKAKIDEFWNNYKTN